MMLGAIAPRVPSPVETPTRTPTFETAPSSTRPQPLGTGDVFSVGSAPTGLLVSAALGPGGAMLDGSPTAAVSDRAGGRVDGATAVAAAPGDRTLMEQTAVVLDHLLRMLNSYRPTSGSRDLTAGQVADSFSFRNPALRRRFAAIFVFARLGADGTLELQLNENLEYKTPDGAKMELGPRLIGRLKTNRLDVDDGWKTNGNAIDWVKREGGKITVRGHWGIFWGRERYPLPARLPSV